MDEGNPARVPFLFATATARCVIPKRSIMDLSAAWLAFKMKARFSVSLSGSVTSGEVLWRACFIYWFIAFVNVCIPPPAAAGKWACHYAAAYIAHGVVGGGRFIIPHFLTLGWLHVFVDGVKETQQVFAG